MYCEGWGFPFPSNHWKTLVIPACNSVEGQSPKDGFTAGSAVGEARTLLLFLSEWLRFGSNAWNCCRGPP